MKSEIAKERGNFPLTTTTTLKEEAQRLIDRSPDDANWDDLMEEIYIRIAIENGFRDSDAERTTLVEEVRAQFGLPA